MVGTLLHLSGAYKDQIKDSIVLRPLLHPFFQDVDIFFGQAAVDPVRHFDGGVRSAFDQLYQYAGEAVARGDDAAEFGALHQALVSALRYYLDRNTDAGSSILSDCPCSLIKPKCS